jgi:hypothetical protein
VLLVASSLTIVFDGHTYLRSYGEQGVGVEEFETVDDEVHRSPVFRGAGSSGASGGSRVSGVGAWA